MKTSFGSGYALYWFKFILLFPAHKTHTKFGNNINKREIQYVNREQLRDNNQPIQMKKKTQKRKTNFVDHSVENRLTAILKGIVKPGKLYWFKDCC